MTLGNAGAAVLAQGVPEPASERQDRGAVGALRVVVFLVWLLGLASYSPPGREAALALGQLDWIAVVKVVTRLIALILLGVAFVTLPNKALKRRTLLCLLPFGLYALWAIISTLWSPLKAVSLGHAGELVMFLALSTVTAAACTDDQSLSRILFHVAAVMLLIGTLNAVAWHALNSGAAGGLRPGGYMHPNMAAQAAGEAIASP